MDETVTAAEANRSFSRLLRTVRETGKPVTVTSHGKPVARIVAFDPEAASRAEARAALLKRLASQPATDIGPWTRDELYER